VSLCRCVFVSVHQFFLHRILFSYLIYFHNVATQAPISGLTAVTFIITSAASPAAFAQVIPGLTLPQPGTMVMPTAAFSPLMIKGVNIHPDNALMFDFVMDEGDTHYNPEQFKEESRRLIRYFMASLTVPQEQMWVNLSPYEQNRIIPDTFGQTEMGRDLLAQDYMLKQLTSSLMYPEDGLGKKFWKRVRKLAKERYGTTDIPMDTYNKIWIVPETARIYEHEKGAFVVESRLKVMLEEDYLALAANQGRTDHGIGDVKTEELRSQKDVTLPIVRELLIPEIEREVNEGKIFANLRQIHNAMILAKWYKDLIKEDYDEDAKEVLPRRYFSGGIDPTGADYTMQGVQPGKEGSGRVATAGFKAPGDQSSGEKTSDTAQAVSTSKIEGEHAMLTVSFKHNSEQKQVQINEELIRFIAQKINDKIIFAKGFFEIEKFRIADFDKNVSAVVKEDTIFINKARLGQLINGGDIGPIVIIKRGMGEYETATENKISREEWEQILKDSGQKPLQEIKLERSKVSLSDQLISLITERIYEKLALSEGNGISRITSAPFTKDIGAVAVGETAVINEDVAGQFFQGEQPSWHPVVRVSSVLAGELGQADWEEIIKNLTPVLPENADENGRPVEDSYSDEITEDVMNVLRNPKSLDTKMIYGVHYFKAVALPVSIDVLRILHSNAGITLIVNKNNLDKIEKNKHVDSVLQAEAEQQDRDDKAQWAARVMGQEAADGASMSQNLEQMRRKLDYMQSRYNVSMFDLWTTLPRDSVFKGLRSEIFEISRAVIREYEKSDAAPLSRGIAEAYVVVANAFAPDDASVRGANQQMTTALTRFDTVAQKTGNDPIMMNYKTEAANGLVKAVYQYHQLIKDHPQWLEEGAQPADGMDESGAGVDEAQPKDGLYFIFGTGVNGASIKGGKDYTDDGRIQELGHVLVWDAKLGKWVFYAKNFGKFPELKDGDYYFGDKHGGKNMAIRAAREQWGFDLLKEGTKFQENLSDITTPEQLSAFLSKKESELDETEQRLQAFLSNSMNELVSEASENDPQSPARAFVEEDGFDKGLALSAFVAHYQNDSIVENIVLGSGIGEHFGGEVFLEAVRGGLRQGLTEAGVDSRRIEVILKGLVRSRMDWERELAGTKLTPEDIRSLQDKGETGDSNDWLSANLSIGGTKIGSGLSDISGTISGKAEIGWKKYYSYTSDAIVQALVDQIEFLAKRLETDNKDVSLIKKIGIAFAGPLDSETGVVGTPDPCPNLPFDNFNLRKALRAEIAKREGLKDLSENLIIEIKNDAKAAATGEASSPKGSLIEKADAAQMTELKPGQVPQNRTVFAVRNSDGSVEYGIIGGMTGKPGSALTQYVLKISKGRMELFHEVGNSEGGAPRQESVFEIDDARISPDSVRAMLEGGLNDIGGGDKQNKKVCVQMSAGLLEKISSEQQGLSWAIDYHEEGYNIATTMVFEAASDGALTPVVRSEAENRQRLADTAQLAQAQTEVLNLEIHKVLSNRRGFKSNQSND